MKTSSLALCIALCAAAGGAAAQAINDPTRPPAGFAVGDPEVAGEGGGGAVLQSVMISPSGRAAIINGEMVKLGQKYGDAVLIRVAESEVTLKSSTGTQVLKMYPGVDKREIAPRRSKGRPPAEPAAAGSAGRR
jgi:MSHA biogenesis protein MshK